MQRRRVELDGRRRRECERTRGCVEIAIGDTKRVAAEDQAVVEIDGAVVMSRVPGSVDELERTRAESQPIAVLDRRNAFRRHGHELAIKLAEQLLTIDRDRACDQLRW